MPHVPGVRVRNTRTGFIEDPELEGILSHLPEVLRTAIRFIALTGWRKREVLLLQWRQVDWTAKVVRLDPGSTKNDEGRVFPFGAFPELEEVLRLQRAYTDKAQEASGKIIPWVFHRNGRFIRSYDTAWRTARQKAALPGALVHDLRRSAVRRLERAGVSRSVAMKPTGHKTEAVYRRYAIVSETDLAEGVAKLADFHAAERKAASRVVPMRQKSKTG